MNTVSIDSDPLPPVTGRLATMHAAGGETPFTWRYVEGSDLKQSLAYPNGLTANWAYGSRNELLEVDNAFPTGSVSKFAYTYDAAGSRIGCDKSGTAFAAPDTYAYLYNARSELTNATASVDTHYRYGYRFDDIGNRESSVEPVGALAYTANNLNQYTEITSQTSQTFQAFTPSFDADGNQTLVKTATGIWQITYNGENRPILWTQGTNTVVMAYDRMGRRVTKNDQHFVYDDYLQIADNAGNTYVWDPTEPVATRPLVWKQGDEVRFYTHDGNKNVSEVVSCSDEIAAHYEYAPFGAVTARSGDLVDVNLWRFSCEYAENDTATVYYNFRHYEPDLGFWCAVDPEIGRYVGGSYSFCENGPTAVFDVLGLEIIHQLKLDALECPAGVRENCDSEIGKIIDALKRAKISLRPSQAELIRQELERVGFISKTTSSVLAYSNWTNASQIKRRIDEILAALMSDKTIRCCGRPCIPAEGKKKPAAAYVPYKSASAGQVDELKDWRGQIVLCEDAMRDAKSYGGCGCIVLHEVMHSIGMSTDQDRYDRGDYSQDEAMITIANILLDKAVEFDCKGYGNKGKRSGLQGNRLKGGRRR